MDDQKLHEILEQLQVEIKQAKNVDAKGRDLLREIDLDVHELLKRTENDTSHVQVHPNMIQRFENTIDHLEATHPSIANYLTELLEILSKAGI